MAVGIVTMAGKTAAEQGRWASSSPTPEKSDSDQWRASLGSGKFVETSSELELGETTLTNFAKLTLSKSVSRHYPCGWRGSEARLISKLGFAVFTPVAVGPRLIHQFRRWIRREVQPRRQHWFLNEKSGFPFRTPAFSSVSKGQRRLGEKEYRPPLVTQGVALRVRTQVGDETPSAWRTFGAWAGF